MTVKLDSMACWRDAVALLRDRSEAVIAIAGVFIFLPSVLMAQFVGGPEIPADADLAGAIAAWQQFASVHIWELFFSNLLMSFGSLSIYAVLAGAPQQTVQDHLRSAAGLFLTYILANLLSGLITLAGFFLIFPGLYFAARFAVMPMVLVSGETRSPVDAVAKAWAHSQNNGLSILIFILIISLTGAVLLTVVTTAIGIITRIAAGPEGWPFPENIVGAALETVLSVVLLAAVAAIYRQIAARQS